MIQINNLIYEIGERRLLNGVNWQIQAKRRIALVGPNGAGKTTLLKMLTGQIYPANGEILKPKNYEIGYLPQEERSLGEGTILHLVMQGHQQIYELELKIEKNYHELKVNPQDESTLQQLGALEDRYRSLGGYDLEYQAKAILSGLGFHEKDFTRPIQEFSGGWRMRVYLARILLIKPDLLLLDEPTNHLDLPSLEWLEKYLVQFEGSMVLVSHDRFFIDRLAQEIVALDFGILTRFVGNYHDYEKQKQQNYDILVKKWEAQQDEIGKMERWIDRFRYKATKATQVQSRIKALEKIERIQLPPKPISLNFKLALDKPSYHEVLKMTNLSFSYPNVKVLKEISFNLYRGDRVAVVGQNGAGKTTLTRLIHGELNPTEGTILLGKRVSMAYYAQHQIDALDNNATILEEMMAVSIFAENKVRTLLGVFKFSGADVNKRIQVLSGGEKARVSLAKMLARPANFLIMDEPTNHLDLMSKQALEKALGQYEGTLMLITHDRYFLDQLVNRVVEIKSGMLTEYEGNYTDYLNKRNQFEEDIPSSHGPSPVKSSKRKSKSQKRQEAEARDKINQSRKPFVLKIEALEKEISGLEEKKSLLEIKLADAKTYKNGQEIGELQKSYAQCQSDLADLMKEWENTELALETLMAQLK